MALGNLDINTMERIDNFSPDTPMTQVSHQLKSKRDDENKCHTSFRTKTQFILEWLDIPVSNFLFPAIQTPQ